MKYIYVAVLILFLPAFTQSPVKDTVKAIRDKVDSAIDKKIDTIKINANIDLSQIKRTVTRIVRADSIQNIKDSIMLKDTSNGRPKQ